MTKKSKLKVYTEQIIIATIYVILTIVIRPIGFFQIRISEAMLFLALFNKRHAIGLTLGCFLANFFSDMAVFDIIFGTIATVISLVWMITLKDKYFICFMYPVIFNGLVVGNMLYFLLDLPLEPAILSVMISEFITLYFIGIPLYYIFKKNNYLYNLIK